MPKLKLPKQRTVEVPARIWKRASAFMIDLLIINIVILYPFKKYFKSMLPTDNFKQAIDYAITNPPITETITTIAIMASILTVLYFSLSNHKTGTTIGKYLMKLKTKSTEKESRYWQHLVASLTFIPFMPFILLWAVDPVYMFMNEKRQRLMERIGKLETVEEVEVI